MLLLPIFFMVKLTILYDNLAGAGLQAAWGFSCLIETAEKNILFDTGWDGNLLLSNMEILGISPDAIDILVLSHQHWDHIGGVATFLNANPDVDVYLPSSFSPRLKQEISNIISANSISSGITSAPVHFSRNPRFYEVISSQQICDGIYSTGELGSDIKEQSLVLISATSACILCGCAHPGLLEILESASQFCKPLSIIGGLHGSKDFELLTNFNLIGAGHCTVHKEEIKALYPENFAEISVGYSVEL